MEPACIKMTVLVFIAVFAMRARSQTEHSSVPVNSGTGCNCTAVQETLGIVLINQEKFSSELKDTRAKVYELQVAVSGNQERVFSELQDVKRQLEMLQSAVTSLGAKLKGVFVVKCSVRDCSEILAMGVSMSGVYTVQPLDSGEAFQVYCDMETDGGGWTVFQRRQDGSVDFYLDFANYSRGFGNLEGEFWLGNDNLHRLTAQGEYELRVDLSTFQDESRYAVYDSFSIADVSDNYRLTVGSHSGTAGDSLAFHNNQPFTTKDRNNDYYFGNCAVINYGAWWYKDCHKSNLNGKYLNEASSSVKGVRWYNSLGVQSLKTTEMKIRNKP